jgi:hypothetical protein
MDSFVFVAVRICEVVPPWIAIIERSCMLLKVVPIRNTFYESKNEEKKIKLERKSFVRLCSL